MINGQNMKNIKMTIERMDLNNKPEHGFYSLPSMTNTDVVMDGTIDINEIKSIWIVGEIDELFNQMPKSHKWRKGTMSNGQTRQSCMHVNFNTFFMDGTTGDKNESADKRRIKVIQKLNQLGL
jgi:hypothetical protein